ncbi:DsbA family protein [Candidatus Peregrinibacteria bacterium]|nr:DsbA family protein [Candidatus Peregrinibacteria bacterium]
MQITGAQEPESVTNEAIAQGIENYIAQKQEEQFQQQQTAMQQKNDLVKNAKPVDPQKDHIRGDKGSEISLIEFSDFECPFCKNFHGTAKQVLDNYDGKVNWVYRHYPLSFHDPLATREAIATECANELGGNDKFWEMADLLFDRTTSNGRGLDPKSLPDFAEEIGINKANFEACLESGKFDDHIAQDMSDGAAAGITGTPGNILINNKTGETVLIEGAQPLEVLKENIDKLLET